MKSKKRDPMPSLDAIPKAIGEFWNTHSLADYWDETEEVEFQVNLKIRAGRELCNGQSYAKQRSPRWGLHSNPETEA